MTYKINFRLWACCSLAVFCLFIAFEPGLGGKFWPLRDVLADSLRHPDGRMPIAILLESILSALFVFGIPSIAFGWVLHAIGVVAWSRLTKKNTAQPVPPPLPKRFDQS